METKKLIARSSSVIIGIGLTAISLAAQSNVGYVMDIEGTWILNGSNTLSLLKKLPAGGSIRRQSSSREDRITIADMRGQILEPVSRNCENSDCSRVINLPRKAQSNSLWDAASALFVSIVETVSASPPRRKNLYENRSGELSEDVVRLTDGKTDLSSVLKTQGEQYLRWRVVSQKEDEDSVADWTKPVKLDKTAIVSGFQPGLYEINLVRRNGSNFEPVAAAWILVATPADYEKTRASFQEVQELAKNWGDKVRPETTRRFLQASLENLARKPVK